MVIMQRIHLGFCWDSFQDHLGETLPAALESPLEGSNPIGPPDLTIRRAFALGSSRAEKLHTQTSIRSINAHFPEM